MKIKTFPLGIYMTNCYLVWNDTNEATLFDCGGTNLNSIINFLNDNNLNLKNIILTHGHGDHILGLNKIHTLYPDAEVYIGKEDSEFLSDSNLSLSNAISGINFKYNGHFKTLSEGDSIFGFKVINTPGHTIGSKCFYDSKDGILISGDTLFRKSFGRYDLPTGDFNDLQESLKKLCENLPEDTVVYSGHSSSTTIGEEKRVLKSQGMI